MALGPKVLYASYMKIVIATPFFPPERGVLGQYAEGLEQALKSQGVEVSVVVFSKVRHLPPIVRHIAYAARLLRALRGADLLLALDTVSVGMPAFLASKVSRTPLAIRIGGDFVWEKYVERVRKPVQLSEVYTRRDFTFGETALFWLTRFLVRHTNHLLFTTHFQKDLWAKVYEYPRAHGVLFENLYPPHTGGLTPQGRVFVSAGRGIYLKNYDMLERVFAKMKERHPEIELDTRSLSHAEHLKRLETSYAVIIPSFSEVNSNTAIEAVAAGKPFIMSSDTGTSERLSGCGLYIDTRVADELEKAIEKILDPTTYALLVDAGRAHTFVRTYEDMAHDLVALCRV